MRKLEVRLRSDPDRERVVGQLAQLGSRAGGTIVFEYAAEFLRDPLWLSPFKLPPQGGLVEHRDLAFGPLFGLFDDSLPDGWGLLLMDRFFQQRGSVLAEVSPLDRLAFLGTRTMGALTYHPADLPADLSARALDLQEMARTSWRVLEGTAREVLPQLLRAGGSPGGARPKVLVGVAGDSLLSGEDDLPPGYAPWIVKFPAREEDSGAGAVELAYSLLAREAGVVLPPARLFEAGRRGRYFGVERFDRRGNHRFHVHTFGNLIHANFRVPSCDYRHFLEVARVLTRNHQDVLQAYRRMVFNGVAHNRDDHVKNFAFRLADGGAWELAPAYDLVYSPGPGGEHTMTIDGEGKAPGRSHLLRLAPPAGLSLEEAERILEEVAQAAGHWPLHAREAGVRPAMAKTIERAIAENLRRL